jgi:predicted nucleic acid-binding protein
MKLVLDASAATKWYFHDADYLKASDLRWNFFQRVHELLAPDTFPTHCADTLIQAERKKVISPGEAVRSINDLLLVGIPLHSSTFLLPRATEIAMATRITVVASLYIALAEREQCQFVTSDQKVIRNTRNHFRFILPFVNLP